MTLHERALAARAVERELAGDYESAFDNYTAAVQAFLRTAAADPSRTDARSMAARLLARAEKVAQKRIRSPFARWRDAPHAPVPLPHMSTAQMRAGASFASARLGNFTPARPGEVCQGAASDCTLVAAIEAAAAHDTRWGTGLAHASLFPQVNGVPTDSATYDVRLFIDGEARRITVDDQVPMAGDAVLGAHLCGGSPWPAFIEKAYLHVYRSGYEHVGGDASSDVYLLTGWIPEYIAMHEPSFQREKTWTRIYEAWRAGTCMLTAGTSAALPPQATLTSLVPSHCYSIVDMDDERTITLVNPWKHGSYTIRCSWDDLCTSFSVLHANWDPAHWPCTAQVRGMWQPANEHCCSTQYRLIADTPTPVLVHLERHMEYKDAFIALHAFPTDGRRVFNVDSGGQMGTYTSARHALMRVDAPCTLVASRFQGDDQSAYTLTAYASRSVALESMESSDMTHVKHLRGTWRAHSADAHLRGAVFRHSPQYVLRVGSNDSTQLPRVRVLVRTARDVAVGAVLLRSKQRVCELHTENVVTGSGAYTPGIALCDASAVQPGMYTLVLPTLGAREAEYMAQVESNADTLSVERLPAEGAGMYQRSCTGTVWTLAVVHAANVYIHYHSHTYVPLQLAGRGMLTDRGSACMRTTVFFDAGTYTLHGDGTLDVYGEQPIDLHSGA